MSSIPVCSHYRHLPTCHYYFQCPSPHHHPYYINCADTPHRYMYCWRSAVWGCGGVGVWGWRWGESGTQTLATPLTAPTTPTLSPQQLHRLPPQVHAVLEVGSTKLASPSQQPMAATPGKRRSTCMSSFRNGPLSITASLLNTHLLPLS